MPLGPPFGRAEVYVFTDLLLLNVGHEREHVAVTVRIRRIDVPDPLINVVERCQILVPLLGHMVLCSGVKVRMCLRVP